MTKAITIVVLLTVLLVSGFERAEGNSQALPKGGGEPGKALMAFLEAAHTKDFARIRGMYPDEAMKTVTDKELEQSLMMFILFNPAELNITGGTANGDSATLSTLSHGTIIMRRTNGKWLMERWGAHAETTTEVSVQAEVTFTEGADKPSASETSAEKPPEADTPSEPNNMPTRISFAFDPETLLVLPDEKGGQVVVVATSGEEKMLFHNVESYGEATKVAAILKFYGVNEVVEVSMPGVVESIYLKFGRVASGKYKGEQCTTFNPAALAVTEFKGSYRSEGGQEVTYTQWSVGDGKRMVTRYNDKPFAEEMVSILREYGFTNRCHVGGFWYFRK